MSLPILLLLFAICIEKSTPTPTRIDPIITVTRFNGTPFESITIHCIPTVKPTGTVVNNAYLKSLKTNAKVRMVNANAKNNDLHCEPTINSFISIDIGATPIRFEASIEFSFLPASFCF